MKTMPRSFPIGFIWGNLLKYKIMITERQMIYLALMIDIIAGEDTTNTLLADWLIDNEIQII
jgi:hypothetical protein